MRPAETSKATLAKAHHQRNVTVNNVNRVAPGRSWILLQAKRGTRKKQARFVALSPAGLAQDVLPPPTDVFMAAAKA